jgi:DNA invertase Pin-like site-specific DNA recombinase
VTTEIEVGQKSAATWRKFHTNFAAKPLFLLAFSGILPSFNFCKFTLPGAELAPTSVRVLKKFIGYYRVSTKQQGLDGNGMAAQREIVRRFTEGQRGVLEKEFNEVESGKWTDGERPQLAAALDCAKKIKGVLVIAKLDRLARNAEFLLRLQNSGVDFVCCDCPNADKFTVGILALVAQRERELISERTRLGLAAAKAKGVKLGTPNPQKAVNAMRTANKTARTEFVKKVRPLIEEIRLAGVQTLQGIADCLNRRGIPTRSGKTWHPSSVRNVINGGGL